MQRQLMNNSTNQELKLIVSETYHDSEFENKGRYFANINPVIQDENDR